MGETTTREPFGAPASLWKPVAGAFAGAITLSVAAWSLGVPRMLGVSYYPQQFLAVILALVLPIVFLTITPSRAKRDGPLPWYDAVLALAGLLTAGYIAWDYATVVNLVFLRPATTYVPGILIILLVFEALRRLTGWTLVIIIAAFLLYALFGDLVPGKLAGRSQDWRLLAGYMAFDVNGIFGLPLAVAATIVTAFIFFGALLGATGGS